MHIAPFRNLIAFVALSAPALVSMGCKKHAPAAAGAPRITVAAAADLTHAFKELGEAFARGGHEVPTFTFGSTGLLAKQLTEGAPFDVFAAANVSFVDEVVSHGVCDGATKAPYARGRLVLYSSKKGNGQSPKALAELAQPSFARVAIANPEHAPYGKAAVDALKAAGVWEAVESKLVFGENVQQALQFAQSGNADAAIVALSLALHTDGVYAPIEPSNHRPIEQAMVACGPKATPAARRDEARAFLAFVSSNEGRAIMRRYGFLLPGDKLEGAEPRAGSMP